MNNVVGFRPPRPRGERDCMRVPEAAYRLDLSESMVYRMLRDGRLPSKRAGKAWLIPRKALEAWLEKDVEVK